MTFAVSSFADVADPTRLDGVCDVDAATAGEQCTLRAAIQRLQPLADDGGATPTHALAATSPAIDAGVDADCPPTDQRSRTRFDVADVGSAACDVGAFEFVPE